MLFIEGRNPRGLTKGQIQITWIEPSLHQHHMQTIRQKIITVLSHHEMDARQLSRQLSIPEKEVVEHLSHIARSLAIKGKKLTIRPGRCLLCEYVFEDRRRLSRPGRCPRCKKSHLQSPTFYIT